MTRATCTECGRHFNRRADEDWKTRCVTCWRASRARADNEADRLRVQLSKAMTEAAILRRQVARLETQTGIPPEMLARLLPLRQEPRGSDVSGLAALMPVRVRQTDEAGR